MNDLAREGSEVAPGILINLKIKGRERNIGNNMMGWKRPTEEVLLTEVGVTLGTRFLLYCASVSNSA